MSIQSSRFITVDIRESIGWLTLNRPPLNILTIEMLRELTDALDSLTGQHENELKGLVIAATGKAFCAGVDIADHLQERVESMIREFGSLFTRIQALPMPTISIVQGVALGGGTELAIACDMIVASTSARFGQPEIKLGVFPPIACAYFPQLIGHQQAARLIFSGEIITAAEAAQLGLITFLTADDELPMLVEKLLSQLRGLSARSLHLTRRALLCGSQHGVKALPEIEKLYLHELMATADAHEGMRAFIEKRQPAWNNR